MMRTSSRPWSISRLISGAGAFERRQEGFEARQAGAFLGEAEVRNSSRMSPASWPSRAIILRAHAVAAEHAGIELEDRLEGRLVGPCVELRGDRPAGPASAAARSRSAASSDWPLGRSAARSNSVSSLRPKIGLRSTAASDRSSSGWIRKRPSAIRSLTAIWPGRLSRSAPATGMCLSFRLCDSAWTKLSRLRTSTMTSPGAQPAGRLPSMISPAIQPVLDGRARRSRRRAPPARAAWSIGLRPVVGLLGTASAPSEGQSST